MNDQLLELGNLPCTSRTIHIPGVFLISDNLDGFGGLDFLNSSDIKGMLHKHPFKLKFSMILICDSGFIKVRTHMREHIVKKGDIFIMAEGGRGECLEIDPTSRLAMLAFSNDFDILESKMKISTEFLSLIAKRPVLSLSDREFSNVLTIYHVIYDRLSDPKFPYVKELTANCMRTLFFFISPHVMTTEPMTTAAASRKQIIFDDFLNLLEQNYSKHRDLAYYASRLCITPGYLSRVALEVGGQAAKEYIRTRILLEAKIMLEEPRTTIQQISDTLNFPNQSFFGTYFKKATGISPTAYRQRRLDSKD